jgi:predicted nucleic-acid-binding protein
VIALDTNILLRYLVQDGGEQADLASNLIEQDLSATSPGFVSLAVVCELVWALSRTYQQPRQTVAQALGLLLDSAQIDVERRECIELAILHPDQDVADSIIHFAGQLSGCTHTLTFDKKFARLDGVELLGA